MHGLDTRLALVAQFVRAGSRVADVGTDHAFLPVYLVQSGKSPFAIASDIRQGPVASARHTVAESGFGDRISVRMGNGLDTVSPDEVDDIVIAGMGGETVADILARAPWTQNGRYRLILQPMSKPERLRRFLWENGFDLQEESAVQADGHIYTVMVSAFTGVRRMAPLWECVIGKIPKTADGRVYLQKQFDRIGQRLAGLQSVGADTAEYAELRETLEKLAAYCQD